MEWNDPLVIQSIASGCCTMCDSSYDLRDIPVHLADVHNIGKSPQANGPNGGYGEVNVHEHTRRRPRTKRK